MLLDPDTPVPGITTGKLRREVASIAVPSTVDGDNMAAHDFALDSGWGHFGSRQEMMPRKGCAEERSFKVDETVQLDGKTGVFGMTTVDVYLNDRAYWQNVPAAVWNYKLGGYQVLKKWLSYRERKIFGRPLKPDEVQHLTDTARRIAAILELTNRSPE